MADIKRLKQIIAEDELITAEFKASKDQLSQSVFESICAFLNRKGGHIFLGVDNKRNIVGINPDTKRQQLKALTDSLNNPQIINPPCNITAEPLVMDGKDIIYLYVPESSTAHTYKGKYYDRNFEGDYELKTQYQIHNLLIRKQKESYTENQVLPFITLDDFDEETFREARAEAVSNAKDGREHPWKSMTNDEILRSVGMWRYDPETGQSGYTLGAVLTFGKEVTIAGCASQYETDLVCRIRNTDLYDDRDYFSCNLIQAYHRIMAFIAKILPEMPYMEGDKRISLRTVIFREVAQNMLIHREFSSGYKSSLFIYADRVEVKNWNIPNLMGRISPDNLSPKAKNRNIARVFREMGWAEELGRGTRNLFEYVPLMTPGAKPQMIEDDVFTTIIPLNIPWSSEDTTQKIEENSEENEKGTLKSTLKDEESTLKSTLKTRDKVLAMIAENSQITREEIAVKLGLSLEAIKKHFSILKSQGLIRRVGPDKGGHWEVITEE